MIFSERSAHEFHIPVMGTGFTVGTPVEVAKYGISSVISLVDDVLLEQMRRFYCEKYGHPYEAIKTGELDVRARRTRAYLNLVHDLVEAQSTELRAQPFEPGSDIVRYFELLPEGDLRARYQRMCATSDPQEKARLQTALRANAVPGSIDVNIMTKLDRLSYSNGHPVAPEFSDAAAALRGFATSRLSSSMVFSAGMSAPLYSAVASYPDFLPDADGRSKKTVTLKVSDYRSALIQGRFLAKRGIWVSEFRVESGLNCGGHAFATQGHLMGPILEEFSKNREALLARLHEDYNKGLAAHALPTVRSPREMLITVQGGIGTHEEHRILLQYFKMDRTGWATPFLLVPEVTSVDDVHLQRLLVAEEADVVLGPTSPMGIPFWSLRTCESEVQRRARIDRGEPGSDCFKGYLEICDEFTEVPICKSSRAYQKLKLAAIESSDMTEENKARIREEVLAKACICHDLAAGATLKNGIVKEAYTAICPSPNIVYFKTLASLDEMVGHIYGRLSLIKDNNRPHMFIRELTLYVEHLRHELERFAAGIYERKLSYYEEFKKNLLDGVNYYQDRFLDFVFEHHERFRSDLLRLKAQIEQMQLDCLA